MHTPATPSQMRAIMIFSAIYIVASVLVSWSVGNSEFVFYIVVMALLIGALLAVHRRVGISATLGWCLSLWGLFHMAGGLVPAMESWPRHENGAVLYNVWIIPDVFKYDQFVHAYGFGIATWLCWQALSARTLGEDKQALRPTFGIMVLCAAGGMGLGALNEVVEFIATQTLPETNVGGYVNTGLDLVFNTIGAVIAAAVIHWRRR
ncbi:MAG: hypothetical protein AAGJ79_07625 [Verrucomicrobiota bacterium]